MIQDTTIVLDDFVVFQKDFFLRKTSSEFTGIRLVQIAVSGQENSKGKC